MLSSREHRFYWSKLDRAPAAPFFRMLARTWRPTVRRPKIKVETKANTAAAGAKSPATAKPVWTPWLWVD